jgi:hypothetical protein
MKKATLDATDENILQSIADQIGNRNARILEFIKILDAIEDNRFISLDARWGEGKTFYVRQIEKTLEYQTLKKFGTDDTKIELEEMKPYFANTVLEDIDLENSYFPVYYNAWLYDNHADPLRSLLLVISKKSKKYIDTTRAKKLSNRFGEFLSSFNASVTFPGKSSIQGSIDGEKATNSLKNVDILEEVKTAEEIREEVKRILDEAIVEQAQKLVIFIDELDRCRPNYALEMLERIKHYFDDDRIIFVVSVNKEQLIHTISNYYGTGFDSTGYLNKFFDLDAHLPELQTYDTEISVINQSQHFLIRIANELVRYFKLSRRDFLIYREKINNLESCQVINDYSREGTIASLFVPLLIILDMKNVEEKRKFLNGESRYLEIMKMTTEGRNLYENFYNPYKELEKEERMENGYERFKVAYNFLFGNAEKEEVSEVRLEIDRSLKEKILECCGQMSINS